MKVLLIQIVILILCLNFQQFAQENRIFILKELSIPEPKTKSMLGLLQNLGLEGKTLILLEKPSKEIQLSASNLQYVKVLPVENINIFDLLYHDNLLTTEETAKRLEEMFK